MNEPLYLYLVERTDEVGYDEFDGAVMAAHTRKEAVAHYVRMAKREGPLSVKLIGTALHGVKEGPVHTSFNNA